MDIYGHHIPLLVESGGISLLVAVAVVAAKAIALDRRPTTIIPDDTNPPLPESTRANVDQTLAHARAMVLDGLYRASLACEDALHTPSTSTNDVSEACGTFAAALRRRRPWLPPSLAERAEEFTTAVKGADMDALVRAVTMLRRGLENEFRSASGVARR